MSRRGGLALETQGFHLGQKRGWRLTIARGWHITAFAIGSIGGGFLPGLANVPKPNADLLPSNVVGHLNPPAGGVLLQKPHPGFLQLGDDGPGDHGLVPFRAGRVVLVETGVDRVPKQSVPGMMHLGPPPTEEHVPLLGALDALEFLVALVGLILTSLEF